MSQSVTGEQETVAHPPAGPGIETITAAQARAALPRRHVGAHKWEVGGLVVVGGSPTYIGAVALAGTAAQRAGAGVVQLAVPRAIISPLVPVIPEATYIPLPETESASGARNAVSMIGEKSERASALLIGPGLGQDEGAKGLLGALFGAPEATRSIGFGGSSANGARARDSASDAGPLVGGSKHFVVDADGLNWLAAQQDWHGLLLPGSAVLTPHPGEMARLLQMEVSNIVADPVTAVRQAARQSQQVVVLKYGFSLVSDGEDVRVAPAAPPSLATAGTGDVLAGTIAAFLAQGVDPFDAAALAVYLGCQAALAVEERTGTLGLVASDLPVAIAAELARLEERRTGSDD